MDNTGPALRLPAPRLLALSVALALVAAACGLGSTPEEQRQELIDELVASGSVSENDATCIVDGALEDYTIDELADLNDDDADPVMVQTMTDLTFDCLVGGDAFDDIVEEQGLGDDTSTTVAPTTETTEAQTTETTAATLATDDAGSSSGGATDDGFVEVTDTTDRLRVSVPASWTDTQTEPSGDGSAITISPDVSTYLTSWAIDGMKFSVTNASSPVDWRGPMETTNAAAECTLVSSEPYSDSLYTGTIDRYESCPGDNTAVVIGATDEDESIELLVEVQFDTVDVGDDAATLQKILDTFQGV
jgi:polyhydroxyalkanoate synthesis regulator phasin